MQLLHTHTHTHTQTNKHTHICGHRNIHIICNSADNVWMYHAVCVLFLGAIFLIRLHAAAPNLCGQFLSLKIPRWKTRNLLNYEKLDFLNFRICNCWTANQKGCSWCGTNFKHSVNIVGFYIDTYIHTYIHTHIRTFIHIYISFLCFVDRASRYNRVKKNQLDAQLIRSIFRQPLHVSGVSKPIIRRYNRMYTTTGTYYSF
jgi:hypothetical protein